MTHRPPLEHREAIYWLGLSEDEIVSTERLTPQELAAKGHDSLVMVWRVKLRKGDLEWSGYLKAPPWSPRPPICRIEDLVNSTRDCPMCMGSGKVGVVKCEE